MRSTAIALALIAGTAAAGEPVDCYNDEPDTGSRYTSTEPEVLRVTDADIADMLRRMRDDKKQSNAGPAMHAGLGSGKSTSN